MQTLHRCLQSRPSTLTERLCPLLKAVTEDCVQIFTIEISFKYHFHCYSLLNCFVWTLVCLDVALDSCDKLGCNEDFIMVDIFHRSHAV